MKIKKIKNIKNKIKDMFTAKNMRSINPGSITYEEAIYLKKQGAMLIDVRSPQEYKEGHLSGSNNIPLYELETRLGELPKKDKEMVVYCSTGHRSQEALELLKRNGYTKVYQIEGGIEGK